MTIRRLREQRIAAPAEVETRSGMMASWPMGWGWQDPAAIPPPGLYNQQRSGVVVTTHTTMQVDSVYTALRVLSNAMMRMGPPRAFTWGYDRYNRPYRVWTRGQPSVCTNPFGSSFYFDGLTRSIVSLALFGECFWAIVLRDDMEYPAAVEVLNPAFVAVEPVKGVPGAVTYWYGSAITKVQVPNENMVHIPFLSVPGGRRGLSTIEYGSIAISLALAAMEYGSRWFSQGASPSYILSTEQKLGQAEVERIAEKFLIEHSGLQSAHLPLVVDGGMKAQKISSTPDEAQFLKTLEYARSCVAAWFGLPAFLVGGSTGPATMWGKTIQETGYAMQDFTLSGYTARFEEAWQRLLPPGRNVHFNEEAIQRADSENMAKLILSERQATVRTPNDIRVVRFLEPPLEGGDDLGMPLASSAAMALAPQPTLAHTDPVAKPTQLPAGAMDAGGAGGGGTG